ncbi:hypothetical protein O6H91_07G031400 [Diphasiastrum complanatum]|nr:hypothetical protein O6H91_07G016700 [Diphasiastrum complanatum]KAJ7548869.1 hypothetical protein O6H91_07G031400 [Diphasiastrum complanatum]KAJ7548871.1 hypothetical protein O6H91_07G031400 [Diphasiastrum complanatum]
MAKALPSGTLCQETKSSIWLETMDGVLHEVEWDAAMLFPLVHREVRMNGRGPSDKVIIALPAQVGPNTLKLLLQYCRFHQVLGRSDKERKLFDEKFVRLDTKTLCELTSAADSLDMKALVDLTSRALARMIEGKTPKEIRETFGLPDDLTEEEKLEPVKNTTDDLRIRLLNRLYARKRRELQERKTSKSTTLIEGQRDERSVDDLLSYIDGDAKVTQNGKSKKKRNRKKREQSKEQFLGSETKHATLLVGDNKGHNVDRPELSSTAGDSTTACDNFDDAMFHSEEVDDDDGLDPVMKEKLDREVEDFARRLNVNDWRQNYCPLASSSQDQRGIVTLSRESVHFSETSMWANSMDTHRLS